MGREIERKFLLSEPPEGLAARPGRRIEQGYLAIAGDVEVRLRRLGNELLLTVKRGQGEVREEVEFALYKEQFEALWPLTAGRRLIKTRRRVPLGDWLTAEIDVFAGDLEGLLIGEVEFDSEQRAAAFRPPAWLGKEVTGDSRYAAQSLAAAGLPRQPDKHRAYRLKRKEAVADGIRRSAAGCAEQAGERLREAASGEDSAAAIHAARKDLKKLRSLLRLVRDDLGKDVYKAENRRYRDAARHLAASRDAEVKLQTLATLRERFGKELPAEPLASWERGLADERRRLLDGEDGIGGQLERAQAEIAAGLEAVPSWPLDGGDWELLGPGLRRSYRRGRREMRRLRKDAAAAGVHEWRKRVKDLWYQLRLIRKTWPGPLGALADEAHALADLLGDHHDLSVLAADLAARRDVGERDALTALIERRQDELLDNALDLGRRLFAEKPKAFERRLRSYWIAWRAG